MSVFDFIRQRVQIYDVVSRRVQLRQLGAYWKGSCPFHSETDASFTISPDKRIYYCFGCHEGGDAVSFVAKLENVSQVEAAEMIAEEFGIKIPQELMSSGLDPAAKDELTAMKKACTVFAQWAHQELAKNPEAKKYLEQRGISQESVDRFCLGYFPGPEGRSIARLLKFASKEGLLGQDLEKAGILGQRGQNFWSPFTQRVIFPIRGSDGKTVGFGGRITDPADTRPKYYNSKESDIFHKGSILFGMDLAKQAANKSKIGFLVEGYMDCIAMSQAGFKESFATLGTACTTNHIKLISRFARKLYVVYDADKAGEKAVLKLARSCWDVEIDLKVVVLPAGQDPASFLQSGQSLAQAVESALGIFEFFVKRTGEKFVGASVPDKMAMARDVVGAIQHISDPIKKDLLLLEASRVLQLPLSSIKRGWTGPARSKPEAKEPQKNKVSQTFRSVSSQVVLMHFCGRKMGLEGFEIDSGLRACLSGQPAKILELFTKIDSQWPNDEQFSYFLNNLEQDDKTWVLQGMLVCEQGLEQERFSRLIRELKKKTLRELVAQTRKSVAQGPDKTADQRQVLEKISQLSKKIGLKG